MIEKELDTIVATLSMRDKKVIRNKDADTICHCVDRIRKELKTITKLFDVAVESYTNAICSDCEMEQKHHEFLKERIALLCGDQLALKEVKK